MFRKFIAVSIILMFIVTNIVIADELFLKGSNIPSLKRDFPSDTDKFTFAIIGDKTGGGEQNWHIFDRAINEMNLLNPDFAITVGDHVQGYTTDFAALKIMWDEYFLHLSTLKMPVDTCSPETMILAIPICIFIGRADMEKRIILLIIRNAIF